MKIRASAVTSFKPYDETFCPKLWKMQYIDGENIETPAMKKGKYFEQLCIGSTAGGEIVEPEYLKDGKTLTAPYRDLGELSTMFKMLIENMGIEILDTQINLKGKDGTGILDMLAVYKERKVIIDLKYTETKEDERWSEFGWGNPENKDMFQAAHYVKLYHELHGKWLPFYYLVMGKSNWVKFIKVVATEEFYNGAYQQRVNNFKQGVESLAVKGFPANPEYNKCAKCLLSHKCKDAAQVPKPILVNLTAY